MSTRMECASRKACSIPAGPYINGNREQANEYLIDGILNSEDKNNEVGYTPGIDAVQEFNLITQNASAEFGNYQGGIVSVSVKSGTNSFHGDLYEFFRNDALDANKASAGWTQGVNNGQFLDTTRKAYKISRNFATTNSAEPSADRSSKNKLFFFADYQGQRTVNAGATGAQVLTAQARTGDFGQLCTSFGGTFNVAGTCTGAIGSRLNVVRSFRPQIWPSPVKQLREQQSAASRDTVATNLFKDTAHYPLPSLDSLNGNNIFYNTGNDLNNNQGDLKIDYNVSQKDHLFGRWSQMDLNNPAFTGCVFCTSGAGQGSDEPVRNAVVNWTTCSHDESAERSACRLQCRTLRSAPNPDLFAWEYQRAARHFRRQPASAGAGRIGHDRQQTEARLRVWDLRNLIQVFHSTQGQFEDNVIFTHGQQQIKLDSSMCARTPGLRLSRQ